MRRRSCAVHAESFDDYCVASVQKSLDKDTTTSSPYVQSQSSSDQSRPDVNLNIRSLKKEAQRANPDLWKEFDFQVKPTLQDLSEFSEEISRVSTADDLSSSCGSPLEQQSSDFNVKDTTVMSTIMVIGSQDTEVPKFIDNLFGESVNGSYDVNPSFDLIVKEHEFQGQRYKTKLWVQGTVDSKHQRIIDVYYKSVQSYFFVYKDTSRESYDSLVKMIEMIKGKTPADKFTGVLICVTEETEEDHKAVSEEETRSLVEKYGLKMKIKMDMTVNEVKKEIATALNWKPASKECLLSIQKCLNE